MAEVRLLTAFSDVVIVVSEQVIVSERHEHYIQQDLDIPCHFVLVLMIA